MSIIDDLYTKGVQYEQAIASLNAIPAYHEFVADKAAFKNVIQFRLNNGDTVELLIREMQEGLPADAIVAQKNFTSKIVRYQKKLAKAKTTQPSATLQETTQKILVSFQTMKSLPGGEYQEFRRAKKGIKGETYVGYFKSVKQAFKKGELTGDGVQQLLERFIADGYTQDNKAVKKLSKLIPKK